MSGSTSKSVILFQGMKCEASFYYKDILPEMPFQSVLCLLCTVLKEQTFLLYVINILNVTTDVLPVLSSQINYPEDGGSRSL
jgi:hypothetical protein